MLVELLEWVYFVHYTIGCNIVGNMVTALYTVVLTEMCVALRLVRQSCGGSSGVMVGHRTDGGRHTSLAADQ